MIDISSEKWISGNCHGYFYGDKKGVPGHVCRQCPILPLCQFVTVEKFKSKMTNKFK